MPRKVINPKEEVVLPIERFEPEQVN
jgi:hypothetical protein